MLPVVMDPTTPNCSSSVEDDESSSSCGSFSHNDHRPRNNNGKRCKSQPGGYALSCGMVLPKRHRRRRTLSEDQVNAFPSSHATSGSYAVSHEHWSAKSSSSDTMMHRSNNRSKNKTRTHAEEQRNRLHRRHHTSHRRSPTPFPSLLPSLLVLNDEPFQKYVKKIYSSQFDTTTGTGATNDRSPEIESQRVHPMVQRKRSAPESQQLETPQSILCNRTNVYDQALPHQTQALPTAASIGTHQKIESSYSCDIVLSNQILSMTDALKFSSKPHCLIEATSPHRVLHSNAALFASLLHNTCNHGSIPSVSSTSPSSLYSSWDSVQSQINLLFGLCLATPTSSTLTSESSSTSSAMKGIIILYPVYSTKSDYEQIMSEKSHSSNCTTDSSSTGMSGTGSESIPPRYYLIEVSNLEHNTMNSSTTSISSSIQTTDTKKHRSSMDGLPKLVIA